MEECDVVLGVQRDVAGSVSLVLVQKRGKIEWLIKVLGMNLSAEFDYAPWNQSGFGPSALLKYFKYKYLGFEPRNEKELEQFKAMEAFQQEHNGK